MNRLLEPQLLGRFSGKYADDRNSSLVTTAEPQVQRQQSLPYSVDASQCHATVNLWRTNAGLAAFVRVRSLKIGALQSALEVILGR